MGYTHYWRQTRDFTDDEWLKLRQGAGQVVSALRNAKALRERDIPAVPFDIPLAYEDDEPDRPPVVSLDEIRFNGVGEDGHETFYLTRRKPEKREFDRLYETEGAFDFCKTARKPYDAAVVAVLTIAHTVAPGVLTLSSDGTPEEWVDGHRLAELATEWDLVRVPLDKD